MPSSQVLAAGLSIVGQTMTAMLGMCVSRYSRAAVDALRIAVASCLLRHLICHPMSGSSTAPG